MPSLPTLPLFAKHRRAYRARRPHEPESKLHIATADTLRKHCRPEWLWSHFPSGEARNIRTGAKLKKMGLKRGWPDFVLVGPGGQLHGLELKRRDGELTEAQEDFAEKAQAIGVPYAVARTVDEMLAVLQGWGCLSIRIRSAA
jgi:hypothetical protein